MALIHLTEADFSSAISQGTTLVDFWADWCGPCKMVAPVIEELSNDFAGKAQVAKVDTDANESLAMSLGISAIPTIILFKDGAEFSRIVGTRDKEEYAAAITAAL